MSNFSHSQDWKKDSNNYVAKSYMDDTVPRNSYYEDVKLQMDAKLWGEEYNRHNPPKKVDIFMMAVLEMVERPGLKKEGGSDLKEKRTRSSLQVLLMVTKGLGPPNGGFPQESRTPPAMPCPARHKPH